MSLERYYNNKAIVDTKWDGKAFSGNCIALNEAGDSNQYADITIDNLNDDRYLNIQDPHTHEVENVTLPTSTTFRLEKSAYNIFTTTVPLTDQDRATIKSFPECVYQMWKTDTNPRGLSFGKADIGNIYLCADGGLDGDNIHDVVTDTVAVIQNPTANCKSYFKNRNTGFQNLLVIQDSLGRATDVVDHNTADFSGGANINTNFKPNLHDMTIKEVVSGNLEDLDANGVGLGTFSEREEYRVWKTDGTYKIDNVLMAYYPPAPDPSKYIIINDMAIIGH